MLRIVLASIVGGLIVMVWGAISWMALPFHTMSLHTLPGEQAEVEAMLGAIPEKGVYHYPGFPHHDDGSPVSQEELEATFKRMRRGPVVSLMIVHPQGAEPFPVQNFAIGTAINVFAAGLLAVLVGRTRRTGATWLDAMGVVLAFALFAVCAGVVPGWLWWGYPWLFGALEAADVIVAWLLAGAAIGLIVKPGPSPDSA